MEQNLFIIPDAHLWDEHINQNSSTKIATPNYNNELIGYMDQIKKWVSESIHPIVIFMGDIFDCGFESYPVAKYWESYLTDLYKITHGQLYTVLGNHDLVNQKNNPFWFLVNVKSPYVYNLVEDKESLSKSSKIINIVDSLDVGDTQYIFQHFGMKTNELIFHENAANCVILSHNIVSSPDIEKLMEPKYGNRFKMKKTGDEQDYKDMAKTSFPEKIKEFYVGHLHIGYNLFHINHGKLQFDLQYLGSIGRPTHSVRSNDDLKRSIPVHHFIDGIRQFVGEKILILDVSTPEQLN